MTTLTRMKEKIHSQNEVGCQTDISRETKRFNKSGFVFLGILCLTLLLLCVFLFPSIFPLMSSALKVVGNIFNAIIPFIEPTILIITGGYLYKNSQRISDWITSKLFKKEEGVPRANYKEMPNDFSSIDPIDNVIIKENGEGGSSSEVEAPRNQSSSRLN